VKYIFVGGQHFPGIALFVNNVYRAVKKALVLVPSTSVYAKPGCIVIGSIAEIYRFPSLETPQRFERFGCVEMQVIRNMHLVIVIGYVGLV
jgi:hypothetical protein